MRRMQSDHTWIEEFLFIFSLTHSCTAQLNDFNFSFSFLCAIYGRSMYTVPGNRSVASLFSSSFIFYFYLFLQILTLSAIFNSFTYTMRSRSIVLRVWRREWQKLKKKKTIRILNSQLNWQHYGVSSSFMYFQFQVLLNPIPFRWKKNRKKMNHDNGANI